MKGDTMPKAIPQIPLTKGAGKQPSAPAPKVEPAKPVGLPQSAAEEVFEEDFTDVGEGYPMATEGMHHAKVIDFERADSKSGNPQYVWQFRITAGESKGIEIRYWTSLLPQARWKTAETLGAIGIEAAGSIARFHKSDIIGKPCILEIFHDTYEGKLNHKVQRVHPPNAESVRFAKADADTTPF